MNPGPVLCVLASLLSSPRESDASPTAPGSASPANVSKALPAEARLGAFLDHVWSPRPEWGDMLVAILKGEALEGDKGWWRPPVCLYGWTWLAERYDADRNGRVEPGEYLGKQDWFDRLDRDEDGAITPEDLSGSKPPAAPPAIEALFKRLDGDGNKRVSWDELAWLFQQADRRKRGFLTLRDLAAALPELASSASSSAEKVCQDREDPPSPPPEGTEIPPSPPPEGTAEGTTMPSTYRLLWLFASGQLGSWSEGPLLGEEAPDLSLPSLSTGEMVRLRSAQDGRPVVLIFGSFT